MNNNELLNLKNGLDSIVKYDVNGNPVAAPDADWSMAAQYEKEEEVE